MLKITPVFESPWYEEKPKWPWPIASVEPFSLIPISCDTDDAIMGSFFAGFAGESDPPDERPAPIQLEDIIEDGVLYSDGGMSIEADGITIYPSCCAALGMATELIEFLADGTKPWAGHDPAPWATLDDDEITVWSDGGLDDECIEPCIKTNRHEFEVQLASACATLAAFGQSCRQWLIDHEIPRADEIYSRITRDFEFNFSSTERTEQQAGGSRGDR